MRKRAESAPLADRITSGAVWMILFKLTERSLGLISTIILARLLTPDDFGLVAMATTVIALLEVFTMNDFGSAIIQNQNATRVHYDTAWTMEMIIGVLACSSIAILAFPASHFFGDERLAPVLLVLSIYPLLDGAYNMGCIDFRRNLEFRKEFALQVTRKLSGILISIPIAFATRNYWALIGGLLAGRVGALIFSYCLHPFRPQFSLGAVKEIWQFSRWIMANNALAFLNGRGSHLLMGRLGSPTALGLYSVSFDIANLPTSELAMPINRAVFPGYARIQDDGARLKAGFLRVFSAVVLVTMPAGIGLALVAPTLVPLLLGNKWSAAIPVMQVLAVGGAILALQANVESVYLAKGLTRVRAQITALQCSVVLPITAWLVWKAGAIGAAYAFLIGAVVVSAVNLWRASRILDTSTGRLIAEAWRPVVGSLIMALAIIRFSGDASSGVTNWELATSLSAQATLGACVYSASVFLLWLASGKPDGAEIWIWSYVKKLRK